MTEYTKDILNLKEKAFALLSTGNWKNADIISEEILDIDSRNFDAYLIKIMVEQKVLKPDDLGNLDEEISGYYYQKAILYADADQRYKLESYNISIRNRKEERRLESAYQTALLSMRNAKNIWDYEKTINLFQDCPNYKDSSQLIYQCNNEINELKYREADALSKNPDHWEEAISRFNDIREYKDSKKRIAVLTQAIIDAENKKIAEQANSDFTKAQKESNLERKLSLLNAAAEGYKSLPGYPAAESNYNKCLEQINSTTQRIDRRKQLRRKIRIGLILAAIIIIAVLAAYLFFFQNLFKYHRALTAMSKDSYAEAVTLLTELNDFSDSKEKLNEYKEKLLARGITAENEGDYSSAIELFSTIKGYKESNTHLQETIKLQNYDLGVAAIEEDNYIEASAYLSDLNIKDSDKILETYRDTRIAEAFSLAEKKQYAEASAILEVMTDYEKAVNAHADIKKKETYDQLCDAIERDDYLTAATLVEELNGYSDSHALIADYQQQRIIAANDMALNGKYDDAIAFLAVMTDCPDAQNAIADINNQKLYATASAYENSGNYVSAYKAFVDISSYRDSDSHIAALENKIAELAADAAANKDIDTLSEYISCTGCAKLSEPLASLQQESPSHYAELVSKISELAAEAVENKDIDSLANYVICVGDKISEQIFTLDNESLVMLFRSLSLDDAVQLISSTNSANLVPLWSGLNSDIVYKIISRLSDRKKIEILQSMSPSEASECLLQFEYKEQAELLNAMRKTRAVSVLIELDTEKVNNIIFWLDNRLIGLYINQSKDKSASLELINQFDCNVRTDILQNVNLGIVIDYLWTQTEDDQKTILQNLNSETLNFMFIEPKELVKFGSYVQNESTPEQIEWIVLENSRNNMRLLSYNALDCVPYNKRKTEISWEKSYIRSWLNDTFLKKAFSEDEQGMLINTNNEANGSAATMDLVYLLSCDEYSTYLNNTSFKSAVPTAYAKKQGAGTGFLSSNTKWWLRDSGSSATKAAAVHPNGSLDKSGEYVDQKNRGVRPVINVNFVAMLNEDVLSASLNDSKYAEIYEKITNSEMTGNYKSVTDSFTSISGYRDSDDLLESYQRDRYNRALQEGKAGNYDEALSLLADMFDYEDSEQKWNLYANLKNEEISCSDCN